MKRGAGRLVKNRWVREILAVGWPIAFYWLTCVLAMGSFALAIMVAESGDFEDILILAGMTVAVFTGVFLGQAASLTRVRSSLFIPFSLTGFFAVMWVMSQGRAWIQVLVGDIIGPMLVLSLLIGFIMMAGGFWSLRVNRGLMAAWAPFMLFTAAIIIFTEESGKVAEWHNGAKYAIWTGGTGLLLIVAVFLQIAFMAARERHRLHRWRTSPRAPELVETKRDPIRPLSGFGTFLMLGLLIVVLTGSSAVVAPYLWRTGPGDREGNGGGDETTEPAEPEEEPGWGEGFDGQQLAKRVQQGVSMTCALVTMLVLALLGLFVFGIPMRRQVLLTHLRDPMWPVPPSRRARLHWRLAEIAMGDMGIKRLPGEAARDVAVRAVAQHPSLNLESLVTAAEISDRVNYGYALDANDADTIRRAAEMTYQAAWETLGELDRLRATYRFL